MPRTSRSQGTLKYRSVSLAAPDVETIRSRPSLRMEKGGSATDALLKEFLSADATERASTALPSGQVASLRMDNRTVPSSTMGVPSTTLIKSAPVALASTTSTTFQAFAGSVD